MTPNSVWGALGRAAPKGGVFASELLPSAARPCRALRHLMGSSHRTLHRAVCAHVCARWHTRAHVSMGTCASMHMCWHACVCACMCAYTFAKTCMHMCLHVHVCVRVHACGWECTCMRVAHVLPVCVCGVHAGVMVCVCVHTLTCMCPCTRAWAHTCSCACTHTCVSTCVWDSQLQPRPAPSFCPWAAGGFRAHLALAQTLCDAPPGPCPLSCPCRPRRAITEHSHDVADTHHLGPWLKKAGPHPLFSSGKNNIQFLPLFPAGGFALPASRSSPPPHRCAPDEQRV